MNLDQLDTLLHESPSPAMQLDPEEVLRGGRSRRQRRRAAIGGGVLAGAVLVGAIGFSALRPATHSPLPGGRPTTSVSATDGVSSYYDMADGLKKPGQVTLTAPFVDGESTPGEFTFKVTKKDGVLHLAQVKGSVTVNLPVVQQLAGGLIVSRTGNSTVAVMPTPRDITRADVTGTSPAGGFATNDVGLLLADGTAVTVFLTAEPIQVTGAYWTRGTSLVTNAGHVVEPTRLDDRYSVFVIPELGVRGVIEAEGSTATQALSAQSNMLVFGQQGGPSLLGRWFTEPPTKVHFAWKNLVGAAPKVNLVQITGTDWWIATASAPTDLGPGSLTLGSVSWTDASGSHTDTGP